MGATDRTRVLIVDDDAMVAESLADFVARESMQASVAATPARAMELLAEGDEQSRPFAAVITDLSMPGTGGLSLLRDISKKHPAAAVIVLTGYGSIETAVDALRGGAVDFLTKPVIDVELRLALERALRQHTLASENQTLRRRLDRTYSLGSIVGNDARMRRVLDLVEAVAPSKTTVLMSGESGTGKSLIAHAIHHRSPRAGKPFVELSCGSIPETLLESELFGHVKGAFTGAHADKVGRFLAADGGTLFLDEINSASPAMQLKLLRVLQERKFEPVGGTKTVDVDVRVVLASNQPLEELVASGHFRQDLYYRINVVMIQLPPLRDRVSDIPALAGHFLEKHAAELGKRVVGFAPEALEALQRYPFPGNIRELANIVERAAVLTRGQVIALEDLPPQVAGTGGGDTLSLKLRRETQGGAAPGDDGVWTPMTLEEALREPERRILLKALRANAWNRQKTADQLGINRTTLYKKLKSLGIDGSDERLAG